MINEIIRQDENGHAEARFPNPHAVHEVFANPPPDSHCLQYIDPYGDTVFNRGQVERLMAEFQNELASRSPELQHHIRQLLAFLRPAVEAGHLYVKFVGD